MPTPSTATFVILAPRWQGSVRGPSVDKVEPVLPTVLIYHCTAAKEGFRPRQWCSVGLPRHDYETRDAACCVAPNGRSSGWSRNRC
ncbi:hypothetical protein IAQ61_006748 [Plenodomus lingam]|uniref:uncharacterized protein n=1 Tax=Leptosphaeria maculans TaxID=5022 RepID=UPI0033207C76|nr:hypothetical protein IAQ61_006748 [Plenodomus lingam]